MRSLIEIRANFFNLCHFYGANHASLCD